MKTLLITTLLLAACGGNDHTTCEPTVGEVSEELATSFCAAYAACWDIADGGYQAYCERYMYAELCFINGTCNLSLGQEVYDQLDVCVQAIESLDSKTCTTLVRQWPAECSGVLGMIL